MEKHVTLVGALHIGYGVLQIMGALLAFSFIVAGGLFGARIAEEPWVLGITAFFGTAIAVWVFLVSIPSIIGGIWLLRYRPWARFLVLAASVLILLNFPLGLAIGIYSIWALMQEDTARLFGPCC